MRTLLNKIAASLIILSFFVGELQAADLAAPALTDVWSIRSNLMVEHPVPLQFISMLTRDQLAKTPVWQSGNENPPLSPRKSEEVALAMLHTVVSGRSWTQPDISLRAFDVEQGSSCHRDIRWIYVLTFRLLGTKAFEAGSISIIVLMDGTAIEPKRVDSKHMIPNLPSTQESFGR